MNMQAGGSGGQKILSGGFIPLMSLQRKAYKRLLRAVGWVSFTMLNSATQHQPVGVGQGKGRSYIDTQPPGYSKEPGCR
jgi:hypothetical protein